MLGLLVKPFLMHPIRKELSWQHLAFCRSKLFSFESEHILSLLVDTSWSYPVTFTSSFTENTRADGKIPSQKIISEDVPFSIQVFQNYSFRNFFFDIFDFEILSKPEKGQHPRSEATYIPSCKKPTKNNSTLRIT